MTLIEQAKADTVTEIMERVAEKEGVSPTTLCKRIADGAVVIPKNVLREDVEPTGIGKDLRIKVNANVGTSPDFPDLEAEVEKVKAAMGAGADTVMDLSTGGDLDKIRRRILKISTIPVGTVPIYQAGIKAAHKKGAIIDMTEDDLFKTIEMHAREGVDFMTLHCGVTKESIKKLREKKRITGIVSRGGVFLAAWITHHDTENPLYSNYDYLLEITSQYDITLSLGDGMRPGCLADAADPAMLTELHTLSKLTKQAWKQNVQTIVEGPGHMPLNQIEEHIKYQKKVCAGAPYYVLGPLVTDMALGYDHIAAAIGGALAGAAGADYLCSVSPREHLGLPTTEDVKLGVIAAKIAAHAADIAKGKDVEHDLEFSKARKKLDWSMQVKRSLDPLTVQKMRAERRSRDPRICSMCGEFCAFKIMDEYLK